jgi:exonuclease III
MSENNSRLSLISLNINGLDSTIKRHKLTDWINKQDPANCCILETHLNNKDRHYLRVKGWKKILSSKRSKETNRSSVLIANKIDFQPKIIKHDEGQVRFIKVKNPPRESLNSEHLCPKCKSTQIHKRNFTKIQNSN